MGGWNADRRKYSQIKDKAQKSQTKDRELAQQLATSLFATVLAVPCFCHDFNSKGRIAQVGVRSPF
jgi:hypothetical protein